MKTIYFTLAAVPPSQLNPKPRINFKFHGDNDICKQFFNKLKTILDVKAANLNIPDMINAIYEFLALEGFMPVTEYFFYKKTYETKIQDQSGEENDEVPVNNTETVDNMRDPK